MASNVLVNTYAKKMVYASIQKRKEDEKISTSVSTSTPFDPFDVNPDDPFDVACPPLNGDDSSDYDDSNCDKDYVPQSELPESESDIIENQDLTEATAKLTESEYAPQSELPESESDIIENQDLTEATAKLTESEYVPQSELPESESGIIENQDLTEAAAKLAESEAHVPRRTSAKTLDKKQYCVFCKQGVLKIARHLMAKHKNEQEVAKLMVAKESKTRYHEFISGVKVLTYRGNFVHNIEILKSGGSEIVVAKRPSKLRPASDFLPCLFCYGFFVSEELWKHTKKCEARGEGGVYDQRKTMSHSKALLESAMLGEGIEEEWKKEVRECILTRMARDDIYEIVKKDKLILKYGAVLIKRLGKAKAMDISQRMRQLGRLLIKLKELNEEASMDSFISGLGFDKIIRATEELCGVETGSDGRRVFSKPSLAIRLGHLLGKIGNVKKGEALRCQNEKDCQDSESFLSLLKNEWTDSVSSCALNTLKRRKDHQVQILPLTEDLVKVRNHMMVEIEKLSKSLLLSHDYSHWRKLAQLTMSRLILFNKRRGGEVARVLLKTYIDRPHWAENMNSEILSSLKGVELALIKRLDLIEVPGKKNRKVPILISQEAKRAMEVLAQTRKDVGIPDENPFFFASKSFGGYLDSWQALKAVVDDASVNNPGSISSTRLRKYIATVCQLFDLKEGEMEWLANHMGHELHIHRDFYRLHESTVEMAKVSRLLMAVDSGHAGQYAEIQTEELMENEQVNVQQSSHGSIEVEPQRSMQQSSQDTHELEEDEAVPTKRRKKVLQLDSSSEEENVTMTKSNVSQGLKKKWTTEELLTLKSVFRQYLKDKVYPSGKNMEAAIAKHSCLKERTIAQVRSKIQHLMR